MSNESDSKKEEQSTEIAASSSKDELPPINPPQTKTPVQFNQQINYQQIPPSAWSGLTPDQRMQLSMAILDKMDTIDERHYNFAVDQIGKDARHGTIRSICGTVIAVCGFGLSAYLALHGQSFVSSTISLPLGTIIAMIVGNRVLKA